MQFHSTRFHTTSLPFGLQDVNLGGSGLSAVRVAVDTNGHISEDICVADQSASLVGRYYEEDQSIEQTEVQTLHVYHNH